MYATVIHSLLYSAAGLIDVHTIVELAIINERPHFRKVVREFLFGDIDKAKLPDAWCIYEAPSKRKIKHLRKRGSVQTLSTPSTNILCLQPQFGKYNIYKRRFSHARMTA